MRLLELFESDLYPVPGEDIGYTAMAYWYNPDTKKALRVTRGFDKGNDEGDHHVDSLIKNLKLFGLDTPEMREMINGGDFDTSAAVAYGTYQGWCRVSLGSERGELRATIDASDKKRLAACLRWLLGLYPGITVCEINVVTWKPEWAYKKQPIQSYTELRGKQIETFARTGNVIRLREGKSIPLSNSSSGDRVFENPTPQQMMGIIESNPFREIRFMVSPKVMYAWDSRLAIHSDMHKLLVERGLDPDIQFETGILTYVNNTLFVWHLHGYTDHSLEDLKLSIPDYKNLMQTPLLARATRGFKIQFGSPDLFLEPEILDTIGWSGKWA